MTSCKATITTRPRSPSPASRAACSPQIGLIAGLQDFLGAGVTSFSAGNIILGGAGSDFLEGRGGNDLIDGDAWLNVQIGVYDDLAHTNLLSRHTSMTELVADIFAGTINPGQLGIIREIRTTALDGTPIGPDFDTAVFSEPLNNYTIDNPDTGVTIVSHNLLDGDAIIGWHRRHRPSHRISSGCSSPTWRSSSTPSSDEPVGLLTINDNTPTENQPLTVSAAGVTDADNVSPTNPLGVITGPIAYYWQSEPRPGTGIFEDIVIANAGWEMWRAHRPDVHAGRRRGRPGIARQGRLPGRQRRAGDRVLGPNCLVENINDCARRHGR